EKSKKERLEKLVPPIFLGHLSHKRHRTLNCSVQIFARHELFDKAGIGPILPSYFTSSATLAHYRVTSTTIPGGTFCLVPTRLPFPTLRCCGISPAPPTQSPAGWLDPTHPLWCAACENRLAPLAAWLTPTRLDA